MPFPDDARTPAIDASELPSYADGMRSYTFKCVRAGGPGPAVHFDTCADDGAARLRAMSLFDVWPLAVKVEVVQGERSFEVVRS